MTLMVELVSNRPHVTAPPSLQTFFLKLSKVAVPSERLDSSHRGVLKCFLVLTSDWWSRCLPGSVGAQSRIMCLREEFEFWGAETSAGGARGSCEAERRLPLGALFSAV